MLGVKSPEVVLSYTVKPVIYGSLAAAGVPGRRVCSLITGLGYSFVGSTLKQRLVGAIVGCLYRRALARNHLVMFQNTDDLEFFRQRRLLRPSTQSLVVNGSGVDLDHFAFAPPVHEPVRFLLIARLYREKGIIEYCEAAKRVKARYPHAEFALVGPFDSNPAMVSPEVIAEYTSAGIVEHTGWVADVRPFLRRASVYVLPSYREGTPRTVLEAMAMGRAVITTDAPGCRETVVPGSNGFLVPIRDVRELAAAMERFLEKPELISRMGTAGRHLAEEKYDVHAINVRMLSAMGL